MENLLNNLLPFFSKTIVICGCIALAYFVINQKFKLVGVVLSFIMIAMFSYLILHPGYVQELGRVFYEFIIKSM